MHMCVSRICFPGGGGSTDIQFPGKEGGSEAYFRLFYNEQLKAPPPPILDQRPFTFAGCFFDNTWYIILAWRFALNDLHKSYVSLQRHDLKKIQSLSW